MRIPAARALVTAWPGAGAPAVARPAPSRWVAPWGMFVAIDVHDPRLPLFEDPDSIRALMPSLIAAIGAPAHGPLRIARLESCARESWSAMQFIETGWITLQADAHARRCVIAVFSCRHFDGDTVAAAAVAHLGGRRALRVLS